MGVKIYQSRRTLINIKVIRESFSKVEFTKVNQEETESSDK